jgi:hypothetical protein
MPFANSSGIPGLPEGLRFNVCSKTPSSMKVELRGVRTAGDGNGQRDVMRMEEKCGSRPPGATVLTLVFPFKDTARFFVYPAIPALAVAYQLPPAKALPC